MQEICKKYARNMQSIQNKLQKYAQYARTKKYARNMHEVCKKYARNMHEVCKKYPEYARYMQKNMQRNMKNMLHMQINMHKICKKYQNVS